jgi:hypothetical protein
MMISVISVSGHQDLGEIWIQICGQVPAPPLSTPVLVHAARNGYNLGPD